MNGNACAFTSGCTGTLCETKVRGRPNAQNVHSLTVAMTTVDQHGGLQINYKCWPKNWAIVALGKQNLPRSSKESIRHYHIAEYLSGDHLEILKPIIL